ncbi:MAG: UvrD-helicase domain-containing protein [Planctomycetota bacterium]|jgi:ATP-dependent exoDNAse (exonuclease V) beta subunit
MTKPHAFPHTVIRASAGTGKTFQLTNRFIGLAAEDTPLDTLLAFTFTRKAAGEILDRVMLRLAEAGLDLERLAELNEHIKPANLDQAQSLALLHRMLLALHRLRVGTLDSFFIQIARSFSLELGLSPGWEIMDELEEQRLKIEAIQSVLLDESFQEVKEWMHLLNKGKASLSVSAALQTLARNLHGYFTEAPSKAWEALSHKKALNADQVSATLEAAGAVALPAHKKIEESRGKALESFLNDDWDGFFKNGLVNKIATDADSYYNKTLDAPVKAAFEPLIKHARALWINRLADQTRATRNLLERFDRAYQRLIMERNMLRFDDVTRLLCRANLEQSMDETLYRLDGRIAHLLLDEFQDTSPMQWNVIAPFTRLVVKAKKAHSFFCVGDVKQAIYGWRGGVAEIFEAIQDELKGLEPCSLNKSWRSSQAVIDTVNRAFRALERNEALESYGDAARRWSGRFKEHTTEHSDRPGYCCLLTAPQAAEHESEKDAVFRFSGKKIAELLHQCPGRTIGVLVRTNDAVSRILFELRHEQKIDASGEGGNPLTDSPAVELILSLLKLGDHPGDLAARYHVARSPLGEALQFTDHSDDAATWRLSRKIREDLARNGYGSCIHQWTRELAGRLDERDQKRLDQLAELGYQFEGDAGIRTRAFIDLVETKRVESPSSAKVRVMTIHQAKGLQFDIVVLPELGGRLVGQPPQLMVGRPNPMAEIESLCRYVSEKMQHLLPAPFQESFALNRSHIVEESLCVLYVAMTRAKHSLYMIISPRTKSGSKTYEGLLRCSLADKELIEKESILFDTGQADWHDHIEEEEAPAKEEPWTPASVKLAKPGKRVLRGLERVSPSSMEAQVAGVELKERLRIDAAGALDRGTLMHAWFELIDWLEDGEPDDESLARKAREFAFPSLDIEPAKAEFRGFLKKPAIRALLSRSTFEKPAKNAEACMVHADSDKQGFSWQVWHERPFALHEGDTILSGKIDRLVVLHEKGRPKAADVLDFKTDAIPAGDAKALALKRETYRPQIEAYRKAAAGLLGLKPSAVSARLVFLEAGVIEAL